MKKSQQPDRKVDVDDLPIKHVINGLAFTRKAFRDIAARYVSAVEGEIARVIQSVSAIAVHKETPARHKADLRDMLMILRGIDVKPEKGRRRDLKRIESAIEELRRTTEDWD
jgi:hypothetical protein